MTWVAWRHTRIELLIIAAVLGVLAVYMVPIGLDRYELFRNSGLQACVDANMACPALRDHMARAYDSVNVIGWFNFGPGIVGLLLAVPVVSEFEQRTYRLAWTQSITRERWLLTKLGVAIAGVVIFALVVTALMTWWHAPLDQSQTVAGKDLGQSFNFEGIMPLAYTLFAFSLGVATGAFSRSLVVTMPVTLVTFVVLRLALETVLRAGFASEVTFEAQAGQLAPGEATRDMALFWRTQATEGAIFLGSSAVLLALAVWRVRRRLS